MSCRLDDTIAAIATAAGGAARGVVRLSGPNAVACLAACFHSANAVNLASLRRPQVVAGSFQLAESAQKLPCHAYLWPTARSYTRSPLAEIHTLGSPPLLAAVLRTLCGHGARVAEPGEFTLRAFLGGRIDLAQAEAVLGVIDATGGRQLEVALAQLAGGLSVPLHRLRESLLDLLARLEAGLDFAEEEVEPIPAAELCGQLDDARGAVERITQQMRGRTELSDAPRIVLVGSPNVGKSSLFNALVAAFSPRHVPPPALVSPEPGTTRDYLAAPLALGDTRCELVDTAGLDGLAQPHTATGEEHTAAGAAESISREQHRRAMLRLVCVDASRPLSTAEREWLSVDTADDNAARRLVVLTKCDLPRAATTLGAPALVASGLAAIMTSAVTGHGIRRLGDAIRTALTAADSQPGVVSATAARCHESLAAAAVALGDARRLADRGGGEELVTAELRWALAELGKVTGAVYTDDILDRIFSRFCIGK